MDLLARAFRIPLRVRFRGVDEREGVLLRGPSGWAEFSPFWDYAPPIAARWLVAALDSVHRPWPTARRSSIPVNATVPAVDPQRAFEMARDSGCSTVKIKVADGDDEGRVAAVRDALGPRGRIRVDANGGWDLDTAKRTIRNLSRYDLEYVEQPVATLEDMAALRRKVEVPIAADESVRNSEDPTRVAAMAAADIVVLKVQPLGGVWHALEIAERAGLPVVVSSALETSIGIAAGLALAAALPELPYACGLGTVPMLQGDVVADPLVPSGGEIEIRRPDVDESALARFELLDEEAAGWFDRMRAAEQL